MLSKLNRAPGLCKLAQRCDSLGSAACLCAVVCEFPAPIVSRSSFPRQIFSCPLPGAGRALLCPRLPAPRAGPWYHGLARPPAGCGWGAYSFAPQKWRRAAAVYRPKEGTAILLGGGLPCGPHILRCSKTGRSCCSQDASVVASEPSGALLLHSPYLVLVGAVVFVVFFLLGSLGRGAPARPPAAEADNTIASIS